MPILRRVTVDPMRPRYRPNAWHFDIPAIAQLRAEGVALSDCTVIVGENGAGKSTFMEAVAAGWQGSRLTGAEVRHWSPPVSSEDADLGWFLDLDSERPAPHGGCFLRAEAMHTLFETVESSNAFAGPLNGLSHGEGFLTYLESRTSERGLFLLDEPEAALSFTSCLRLLSLLDLMIRQGSQVVLATHSPVLAALPGAEILIFSETGIARSTWEELELVQHWQAFLDDPTMYLRYLVGDQPDD